MQFRGRGGRGLPSSSVAESEKLRSASFAERLPGDVGQETDGDTGAERFDELATGVDNSLSCRISASARMRASSIARFWAS